MSETITQANNAIHSAMIDYSRIKAEENKQQLQEHAAKIKENIQEANKGKNIDTMV